MKLAVAVILAACCAAQAEIATFEGSIGDQMLKLDQATNAAAEIALPRPHFPDPILDRLDAHCRLESSDRTIELKRLDPTMRFGMFLEGFDGDVRIWAQGWRSDRVHLSIGGKTGSHVYATLPWSAFTQGVPLDLGITVPSRKPGDTNDEWLSCTIALK